MHYQTAGKYAARMRHTALKHAVLPVPHVYIFLLL
jgi:hypothetical protein